MNQETFNEYDKGLIKNNQAGHEGVADNCYPSRFPDRRFAEKQRALVFKVPCWKAWHYYVGGES